MYQAGTLSGNPLAMTAGIATLRALAEPGVWDGIARAGERLLEGLGDAAAERASRAGGEVGTMFGFFFTERADPELGDAKEHADTARFAAFHRAMLERGVYLAPSQFEAVVPLERAQRRGDRRDHRGRAGGVLARPA